MGNRPPRRRWLLFGALLAAVAFWRGRGVARRVVRLDAGHARPALEAEEAIEPEDDLAQGARNVVEEPAKGPDGTATTSVDPVQELSSLGRAARWTAWPVLVAVVPLLAIGVHALSQIHRPAVYGGDYALLEMGARSALHGFQCVGPYSRFGWNHPGPAAFYWSAPFYALSGQRPEGIAIAAVASNLLSLGGVVYVARRAGGVMVGWAGAAVVLFFLFATGPAWLDQPWNPINVILPLAAVGALGAAALVGRRWTLPFVVVAASYSAQTHIGTLPAVAVLLLVLGPLVIWRWRRTRIAWHWPVLVAALVLATMWALPLIEQFSGHPGNLTLAERFFSQHSGTQHSLGEVLKITGPQLTLSRGRVVSRLTLSPATLPALPAAAVVKLGVLLGGAVLCLACNVWRRRWFCAGLSVAGLAGGVASVFAAQRVTGPLFGYLTSASVAMGLILWLALGTTIAAELRAFVKPLPRQPRLALTVLAVITLVASSGLLAHRNSEGRLFATRSARAEVVGVVRRTEAQISERSGGAVYIDPEVNTAWSFAALVTNQLERDGVVVRTPAAWEFMFGSHRTGRAGRLPHLRFGVQRAKRSPARRRVLGQLGGIQAYLVGR